MTALAQLPRTEYAAVSATALSRSYEAVQALRSVSLEVARGEFVAVVGPAGCGKSTLLHLLAGLDTPDAGTVHIAGQDITRMSDRELTRLRREHIGFVFETSNLLPTLSVEENILLPLTIAGRRPEPQVVEAWLARTGLTEQRDLRPAALDGDEEQRVAVARALIGKPTVLFADEPTGNLEDGSNVLQALRAAADEDDQTIVMVTHDERAAGVADRVIRLGVLARA